MHSPFFNGHKMVFLREHPIRSVAWNIFTVTMLLSVQGHLQLQRMIIFIPQKKSFEGYALFSSIFNQAHVRSLCHHLMFILPLDYFISFHILIPFEMLSWERWYLPDIWCWTPHTLWLCQQFAIENGPVEIVDKNMENLVDFPVRFLYVYQSHRIGLRKVYRKILYLLVIFHSKMLVYQSVFFAAPALRSPTRRSAHLWQWPRRPAEQRRTRRLGGFQKPKFLGVPHGENHGKNGENHGIILEKPWEKLEKTLERFQKEWWNGIWCGKPLESGLLWGKPWKGLKAWSQLTLSEHTKFIQLHEVLHETVQSLRKKHVWIPKSSKHLSLNVDARHVQLSYWCPSDFCRHHSQWFHPDFFTQDIPAK